MDATRDELEDGLPVGEHEDDFNAAADYIGHLVSSTPTTVSQEQQLLLYGFYKQATSGDCNTRKPWFWQLAARSKWNAWRRQKGTSTDAAMQRYVEVVCSVAPGLLEATRSRTGSDADRNKRKQAGGMGPVFSRPAAVSEELPAGPAKEQQDKQLQLHDLAVAGNVLEMRAALALGADVNSRDPQRCTPLHFAADRGQLSALELLLASGADVSAADEDGSTPLHYAALCGNDVVCWLLLEGGADPAFCNNEGETPPQLGPGSWSWWGGQQDTWQQQLQQWREQHQLGQPVSV